MLSRVLGTLALLLVALTSESWVPKIAALYPSEWVAPVIFAAAAIALTLVGLAVAIYWPRIVKKYRALRFRILGAIRRYCQSTTSRNHVRAPGGRRSLREQKHRRTIQRAS